jgi:hypothetical protein
MAFPDDQQQNSELILIQAIRASLEEFSVFLTWGWPPPEWIAPFETTAQTTALALPLNQHVRNRRRKSPALRLCFDDKVRSESDSEVSAVPR